MEPTFAPLAASWPLLVSNCLGTPLRPSCSLTKSAWAPAKLSQKSGLPALPGSRCSSSCSGTLKSAASSATSAGEQGMKSRGRARSTLPFWRSSLTLPLASSSFSLLKRSLPGACCAFSSACCAFCSWLWTSARDAPRRCTSSRTSLLSPCAWRAWACASSKLCCHFSAVCLRNSSLFVKPLICSIMNDICWPMDRCPPSVFSRVPASSRSTCSLMDSPTRLTLLPSTSATSCTTRTWSPAMRRMLASSCP
mmetsp:Transcript_134176/g.417013  ORF Transcript_134176/g.417013 Transcript_134176/m.417013 type:complete len:251 (+) Transcript_134176:175-927(+)